MVCHIACGVHARIICSWVLVVRIQRVPLTSNTVPPTQRLTSAYDVGREVSKAVDQRQHRIGQYGLDPLFSLPDANWHETAPNDYINAYKMLSRLDWPTLQFLRLRSQPFTGYNMLYLRNGAGFSCTDPIPPNLDHFQPDLPDNNVIFQWKAFTENLPNRLIYRPPLMLGERGWLVDDDFVNHDVATYQERMALMAAGGVFEHLDRVEAPRIIEIGGGYGALAYAIMSAYPNAEYWICDLPESLMFSGLYLSMVQDQSVLVTQAGCEAVRGINLLPNYYFPFLGRSFDLAINTLSMSEMSVHQVETYGAGLARLLLDRQGMFFEQNHDNRRMGLCYSKEHLPKYFPNRRTVDTSLPISNGIADIWSH